MALAYSGIPEAKRKCTFESFKPVEGANEALDAAWLMGKGEADFKLLLIYGGFGNGKCVAWDSFIPNPDGRLKTIKEIYEQQKYKVFTLKVSLDTEEVGSFLYDGVRPCYEVTTQKGRRIKLTSEHPLLTLLGWQKVKDLLVGERIAIVGKYDIEGTFNQDDYKVILLANILGEGGLTQAQPIFTSSDKFAQDEVEEAVNCFGCRLKELRQGSRPHFAPSYGIYSQEGHIHRDNFVKQWLIELGLWGRDSKNKIIPQEVFQYTKTKLALFLATLFNTDGWISIRNDGGNEIGYSSTSLTLIQQLNHLLLRFGIVGMIRESPTKLNGKDYISYRWHIQSRSEIHKFLDRIPIRGRLQSKAEQLARKVKNVGYGDQDILWDKIKSIKSVVAQPVFDLVVPTTGNFIANDIVAHNTHLAYAAGLEAAKRGLKVRFEHTASLMSQLRLAMDLQGGSADAIIESLKQCDFLILDDLGAEQGTGWQQSLIEDLINHRYSHELPLIATTNKDLSALPPPILSRFRDKVVSKIVMNKAPDFRPRKNLLNNDRANKV
jgi:hypothetical protein